MEQRRLDWIDCEICGELTLAKHECRPRRSLYVMRRLGERLQVVGVEQASGLEQIRVRRAQLEASGYVTTTLEPSVYARLYGVEVTFA